MRKLKWYDWIPIVGFITTKWGSSANGNSHFQTLIWGFWMFVSIVGLFFLLTLI